MFKRLFVLTFTITSFLFNTQSSAKVKQVETDSITSNYAKTQYPIVLVHGMFGFTRMGFDAFGMDYFYQILPDLARNGSTVFPTQVSPLESTELRGEQLLMQIEEVKAITGKEKVNLIGHSHGGPTIRYIAIVRPDLVASITGIAGSFRGAKLADNVLSKTGSNAFFEIVGGKLLAPTILWTEGNPNLSTDMNASLKSLSVAGSKEFNDKYPTAALAADCSSQGAPVENGIYYYSWTGKEQVTNLLDVIDSTIMQIGPLVYGDRDNDGLVPRCSTHIGQVIRDDYDHNHLDEVNMMFGLRKPFSAEPVSLFRQHANRLKNQGL